MSGRAGDRWVRFSLLAFIAVLVAPGALAAQNAREPLEFGGLLRTGLRIEPDETGRVDGFEIFDARAKASGQVGLVFDYLIQVEFDTGDETFRLLDAAATIPILPEFELSLGLFRPAFGLEAGLDSDRGDLTFLEPAQATAGIAPGRQVGLGIDGSTFDGRLTYGAGVFNGNGSTVSNDGGFMVSGRAEYNSIGTIAFYEDFVIQVGGSLAYSKDTAAPLGDGVVAPDPLPIEDAPLFSGERFLLGADVQATYREWSLTGEYYGADYTPDPADPLPDDASSHGGYVEAGFRAYGAVELVTRYDAFKPAVGEDRRFLLFGFNVYPGTYAKFGLQYAVGLDDALPTATVAGNQFIFYAQVDF